MSKCGLATALMLSHRMKSIPRSAAARAATMPDMPAPTIKTSVSSVSTISSVEMTGASPSHPPAPSALETGEAASAAGSSAEASSVSAASSARAADAIAVAPRAAAPRAAPATKLRRETFSFMFVPSFLESGTPCGGAHRFRPHAAFGCGHSAKRAAGQAAKRRMSQHRAPRGCRRARRRTQYAPPSPRVIAPLG